MTSLLALLAGCPDAGVPPASASLSVELPVAADDAHLVALTGPRLARRMSLDLRGQLPSVEELDAVEADPDAIAELRAAWMEEPAFEERLAMLFGERWFTRLDGFVIIYSEYPTLDAQEEYRWERAIGEEPVRLLARVGASDTPWTDIVTTDFTMANEWLAPYWPLDYPDDGEGWKEAHYTDGRPAAGVLSTNGLWWRYYSTFSNYNRGRAAAISRLLLCEDYLARPVSFDSNVALVDTEGVEEALRANPYCLGCHSSLDPAASTLFGFWAANVYNGDEMSNYHAEREPLGESALEVAPEWFGRPVSGLEELGLLIADDPRFARCTARSVAEMLWRRDVTPADFDRVEGFRQAWLDGDERLKPLVVAVTDSAVYRAGALGAEATDAEAEAEATARLLNATLLRSTVKDLVGVSWESFGFDLLDSDTTGYRIMGGGVDGEQVTRPQAEPNLTWSLTVQRVGELVGQAGTEHLGEEGSLLPEVDTLTGADDAAFDAQLRSLSWRLLAERPTDEEIAELRALWESVNGRDDSGPAWKAVVTALFLDPRFGSY